jgi:hypothetical protein
LQDARHAPAHRLGNAIEQQLDLAAHRRADDAQLPLGLRRSAAVGRVHSRTTAITDRRNRSTRHVTKSTTRRGGALEPEGDLDTTGRLAVAKIRRNP